MGRRPVSNDPSVMAGNTSPLHQNASDAWSSGLAVLLPPLFFSPSMLLHCRAARGGGAGTGVGAAVTWGSGEEELHLPPPTKTRLEPPAAAAPLLQIEVALDGSSSTRQGEEESWEVPDGRCLCPHRSSLHRRPPILSILLHGGG